jgi:hypothetical protein
MAYLISILAGIAGAAAGWMAAAAGGMLIMGLAGVSDFEGARAMGSFFVIGPIGGILGLIAGIWLALRFTGRPRRLGALAGHSAIVLVTIAVLVAGFDLFMTLTDDVLVRNGPAPHVEFEIRLPASAAAPARNAVEIRLDTDKNQAEGTLNKDWLRHDGDRAVLIGRVNIYFRTSQRVLVLKLAGQPDRLFMLKLAANPAKAHKLGNWQRVDFITDAQSEPRRPNGGAEAEYEIRYRVERYD